MLADATVAAFEKYEVLSKRELESRFEVWVEQYVTSANIEAETAAADGPHAAAPGRAAAPGADRGGRGGRAGERDAGAGGRVRGGDQGARGRPTCYPDGVEGLDLAIYARDNQLAAMAEVREVADKLERIVADDLWPLPTYAEMLFIK